MKSQDSVLCLSEMPFCIGACGEPNNPSPLPNTFPLELCINSEIGRLEQATNAKLEELLSAAYSLGIEMGTPSDNTDLGKPYVLDFVDFIHSNTRPPGKVLEIGAGVGFLSRILLDRGWKVESIEPGKGYSHYWEKYDLEVINDFFPSPLARGPYDLIVFYTVLEHIKDTCSFLRSIASHLAPQGRIILSVPDCSLELENGDPSMLLHEHFQYFTLASLERTLKQAGFDATISRSQFGRSIYAAATLASSRTEFDILADDISQFESYGKSVFEHQLSFRRNLTDFLSHGPVGIYCPGRALAFLDSTHNVRFFDDSPSLQGKFYPPFQSRIESRAELVANPPNTLCIMTRTFGQKVRRDLSPLLPGTTIVNIEDLLNRS